MNGCTMQLRHNLSIILALIRAVVTYGVQFSHVLSMVGRTILFLCGDSAFVCVTLWPDTLTLDRLNVAVNLFLMRTAVTKFFFELVSLCDMTSSFMPDSFFILHDVLNEIISYVVVN